MDTRYLNFELKKEIKKNVKDDVIKTINKSLAGKELAQLQKKTIQKLRLLVQTQCPDFDLEILKKYNVEEKHSSLKIAIDGKTGEIRNQLYHSGKYLEIKIEPPIFSEKVANNNLYLIQTINKNSDLVSLCTTVFKIGYSLKCEIEKTIEAYMKRVGRFRTVKTLLNAYPDMKKYIPKIVKLEPKKKPAEDKVIELYEAS